MAMISIILADGNVSEGETQSLVQSISFIKNPQVAETLKKYIAYQTVPNLTAFTGWETKPKNRGMIMLDLMHIAIADRDFSPKERELFIHIGKLLGFNVPKVEELISMGTQAIEGMD